jgi:hypothetical protein
MQVNSKLEKYMAITKKAFEKVKIKSKKGEDLLDIAKRYYEDAQYYSKTDKLTALIAVTYAHAFLDCGARLGFFDVGNDSNLFMVD